MSETPDVPPSPSTPSSTPSNPGTEPYSVNPSATTTSSGPASSTGPVPPPTPAQPVDYQSLGVAGVPPYLGPPPDAESRQWGMIAHLSALIGLTGIPSLVGPLIVWLMKKDTLPFVADQGREALNFHITLLIVLLVAAPTICIGIGAILLPAVGIAGLVFTVIGGIKANNGEAYRYPLTLRLIK